MAQEAGMPGLLQQRGRWLVGSTGHRPPLGGLQAAAHPGCLALPRRLSEAQ